MTCDLLKLVGLDTFIGMGLFDIFKRSAKPFKDPAVNLIYDLLFCDDIGLYKSNNDDPSKYPWDILFNDGSSDANLEKIATDISVGSRVRVLAYNKLLTRGLPIGSKELLGVIIEIGLDNGLDVLGAFNDGSARYINQSGRVIIWETTDQASAALTTNLFENSYEVVKRIGPWDKQRRSYPTKGTVRLTFLVNDGLYFGEGPMNLMFNDPMAGPTLASAAQLMKYLIEKAT